MLLIIINLVDEIRTDEPNNSATIKIAMHKEAAVIKIETKILILQTSIQTALHLNQIRNVNG